LLWFAIAKQSSGGFLFFIFLLEITLSLI